MFSCVDPCAVPPPGRVPSSSWKRWEDRRVPAFGLLSGLTQAGVVDKTLSSAVASLTTVLAAPPAATVQDVAPVTAGASPPVVGASASGLASPLTALLAPATTAVQDLAGSLLAPVTAAVQNVAAPIVTTVADLTPVTEALTSSLAPVLTAPLTLLAPVTNTVQDLTGGVLAPITNTVQDLTGGAVRRSARPRYEPRARPYRAGWFPDDGSPDDGPAGPPGRPERGPAFHPRR